MASVAFIYVCIGAENESAPGCVGIFSGTKLSIGPPSVSAFSRALTRTEQRPSVDQQGRCRELGQRRPGTASGFGIAVCRCLSSHRSKTTGRLCSLRQGKGLCYSASLPLHAPLTPLFPHQSPPPRVHRKEVKKQSSKTEGIVVYLFHNRFSPRTKVLDTWACTYFHDSFGMLLLAILGGLRSSGLPVKCKKGLS